MPRDYANKSTQQRKSHSLPGWAWMIGGLTVGLFVALLVYISEHKPNQPNTPDLAQVVENFKSDVAKANLQHQQRTTTNTNNTRSDPSFDFYRILPEIEVPIPDLEALKKQERNKKLHPKFKYILQAGSFKQFSEADKLKAKLALLGISAEIQSVTINKTNTWHRVRIGPFSSARKMDKIRHRLQKARVQTMVLKMKT